MKKKKSAQSVTLSVSHSLFLTRKQRYDLHEGKTVKIIGASMPVWFCKGSTSEPAEEVFCKYTIYNKKGNGYVRRTKNNSYIINLPQIPEDYKEPILSNNDWRKMSERERKERGNGLRPLSDWYEANPVPLSSKKLLDIADGGCQSLSFKLQQDVVVNDIDVAVVHFVLFKTAEDLNNSLSE